MLHQKSKQQKPLVPQAKHPKQTKRPGITRQSRNILTTTSLNTPSNIHYTPQSRFKHLTHSRGFSSISTTIPATTTSTESILLNENPASLEFYHFTNPKVLNAKNDDAFFTILKHPAGQILLSQYIANHITLHINYMLKHLNDPNVTKYTTKGGSLLVGYDVNHQYRDDMRRQRVQRIAAKRGKPVPDMDDHGKYDISDTITAELEAQHALQATHLAAELESLKANVPISLTGPQETPQLPHRTDTELHAQLIDLLPWVDYGFLHIDPTASTHQKKTEEYNASLQKHLDWVTSCGLTPDQVETVLEQVRADKKRVAEAKEAAILAAKSSRTLLLEEINKKRRENEPVKWKDMTEQEKLFKFAKIVIQAITVSAQIVYHVLSCSVALLIPSAAKKMYKDFTRPFTIENFKKWGIYALVGISRGITSTATAISTKFGQFFKEKAFPTLSKKITELIDRILRLPSVISITAPILKQIQSTRKHINSTATLLDEWLGTEYAKHPTIQKIHKNTTFPSLLDVVAHPGPAPVRPKPFPYNNIATPLQLFDLIRHHNDDRNVTCGDILSVAGVDTHRLLLSYVNKLRNKNESPVVMGLVPNSFEDLPKSLFEPRVDPKTGLLHTFPLLESYEKVPELILMNNDAHALYEEAGLRQHPDIWLSPRILDKIPAPDLGDIGDLIHKIDPSFIPPIPKRKSVQKQEDETENKNETPILTTLLIAFAIGFCGVEGYQIAAEWSSALINHPDTPRIELLKSFLDFYGMRTKAGLMVAIDSIYSNLTGGKHIFDTNQLYTAVQDKHDNFEHSYAIEQYNQKVAQMTDEQLNEVLAQIKAQLEQEYSQHGGEHPEYTMLTPEQAAAIRQANAMQREHTLTALSLDPRDDVNVFNTPVDQNDDRMRLSQEDIEQIELAYPKLREQVSHPFGLAGSDLEEYKSYFIEGNDVKMPEQF